MKCHQLQGAGQGGGGALYLNRPLLSHMPAAMSRGLRGRRQFCSEFDAISFKLADASVLAKLVVRCDGQKQQIEENSSAH